jgi:alkylation response protein AidB-like acyl-CoA dehydrogenase
MASEPNFPRIDFHNLFAEDPLGEAFFTHWLGATAFHDVRSHFFQLGRLAARSASASAHADRSTPVLRTHDPSGERISRVEYHPDYLLLEEASFGAGIVSIKYDEALLKHHRDHRQLVGFGAGYYFAQAESSLYCPICMTDGLARVLERWGKGGPMKRALEHLTTQRLADMWQGAMFITERQGGSDVGQNRVSARRQGDRWLLTGTKWFCSNVDAEATLVLARQAGSDAGTKGLGLFLVLREIPEGNHQTIAIQRLKDKLGVRSMATGEVEFQDTEAYLVAGAGEGFKAMAEMMNLARLYNAVASIAIMRRALLEALGWGSRRRAFGKRLWELPLWRAGLADLQAEFLGQFCLTFEAVRALDRADQGDERARLLWRTLVPIAKALTGQQAVFTASQAMEAIGGNAFVEEHILPRLLRDAQVLPIWEGTTHIQSLELLRLMEKERAHEVLFERIAQALEAAARGGVPAELVDEVTEGVALERRALEGLLTLKVEQRQREARRALDLVGRSLELALLCEAATSKPLAEACLAAVQRLMARLSPTAMPATQPSVELADTEEPLLRAGFLG